MPQTSPHPIGRWWHFLVYEGEKQVSDIVAFCPRPHSSQWQFGFWHRSAQCALFQMSLSALCCCTVNKGENKERQNPALSGCTSNYRRKNITVKVRAPGCLPFHIAQEREYSRVRTTLSGSSKVTGEHSLESLDTWVPILSLVPTCCVLTRNALPSFSCLKYGAEHKFQTEKIVSTIQTYRNMAAEPRASTEYLQQDNETNSRLLLRITTIRKIMEIQPTN